MDVILRLKRSKVDIKVTGAQLPLLLEDMEEAIEQMRPESKLTKAAKALAEPKKQLVSCPTCGKTFKGPQGLTMHRTRTGHGKTEVKQMVEAPQQPPLNI